MLLKEKNKTIYFLVLLPAFLLVFNACRGGDKTLSEEEIRLQDSLSRVEQKRKGDSMKKANPLLIMPPDSQYTGDYTDKYDNGIIKFKGFFRFGQRHGHWRSFYPSGNLWSEMHYDKGLGEGQNITYYENGKIRYEGYYKKDRRDSLWTYYDTSGVIIEKIIFKNDQPVKRMPQ